jgi:predicted KAP-like P-loop ATPase
VTFRSVIGEVNPVDFIAIESFRMFCPEVYDIIRNNREMFTGYAPDSARLSDRDELSRFHNEWLGHLLESRPLLEGPIKATVQRLFPKLQAVWGNTHFGPSSEAGWRRNARICSDSIFPVYFGLTIPAGEISNSEMQAILANAGNVELFRAEILKLAGQIRPDGKTRASALLDRLQDYTDTEINIAQIEPIVSVLLDIGDQLMRPDEVGSGIFDLGVDVQAGRVIWQLLKRLEAPRPYEILRQAFQQGHALFVIQKALIVLSQQQGLFGGSAQPEGEWFVTREQLLELERVLVAKIRHASHDGSLLSTPMLLLELNFWSEKGGKGEAQAWVAETVRDDKKLAKFLEACLRSSSSFSSGDAVGQRRDRLDPDWLKAYLDADEIVGRVRNLSEDTSLSDRERRAAAQYLKEYNFRKRGGNPDDPFTRDEIA